MALLGLHVNQGCGDTRVKREGGGGLRGKMGDGGSEEEAQEFLGLEVSSGGRQRCGRKRVCEGE